MTVALGTTTSRAAESRADRAALVTPIVLRWVAARPPLAGTHGLGGPAPGHATVAIEWAVRPDGSAEASLVDGGHRVVVATLDRGSVIPRRDSALGLIHLDSRGAFAATLRERAPRDGDARYTLVYARTGLLRELGLPGGRYEPTGALAEAT